MKGRGRQMSRSHIGVRIPPLIMEKLNQYLEKTKTTTTEVVVTALAEYLDCREGLSIPTRMAEVEKYR